jgi:hypothetical protein
MARGVIHDWEGVEHLWRAAFDTLGVARERQPRTLW